MTQSDVPSAMPTGDASPHAAVPAVPPGISAGARDHHTTASAYVTEREAMAGPLVAWRRLTSGLTPESEVWSVIDERLRALRARVGVAVQAAIDEKWPADGTSPRIRFCSSSKRAARREANLAAWWAARYAARGDTPRGSAVLTWARIGSDLAKLRRCEMPDADMRAWVHAEVDAICRELSGVAS